MLGRNKITFKRIQSVQTPTGYKDEYVELFSAFAEIEAYSAKYLQKLSIDLKQDMFTIKIRYSTSRDLKVGDKAETLQGELTIMTIKTDTMGKEKFFTITASKNGI